MVGYSMFIDGVWVDAIDGGVRQSIDPYTGEPWATVPEATEADVDRAVRAARKAFDEGPWPNLPGKERGRLLHRLADLMRQRADRIARVETRDNGKLLREMAGQLAAIPDWYDYFAGWADKLHGEVIPSDKSNFLVYTLHEPVGVVGAIVPWNSPMLLTAQKLAPALAAGCTFVLKPAEQTPASALELAKLVEEAGFPAGVFNVVTGDGPRAGAALARHPGVDKVAFTGSTAAGISVAKGAAEHMARTSLELGGKSPNIFFDDVDLDAALNGAVAGIFAATGQTCIAGSRIFVQASIHDDFVAGLVQRARDVRLGNPMAPETQMGPVAFPEQLDKILSYVRVAVDEGAEVAAGGGRPADPELGRGLFVEPTVLTRVRNDMRVAQEEIFGPVACVMPFADEDEAVRLANAIPYGLGAGIWTRDVGRAHRVAARIRAGTVWINSYRTLGYNVPFGGFKMSGYGRENGLDGLREYTQVKSVWVETTGASRDPFRLG